MRKCEPAICAVVVAFNPDPGFPGRIANTRAQVKSTLVVDNASGSQSQALFDELRPLDNLEIIRNSLNLGVAAALNMGMHRARTLGYQWALTLDQDSVPETDMVAELSSAIQATVEVESLAIVAPQTIDSVSHRPAAFLQPRFGPFYRRTPCVGDTMEVTSAISSGSLVNLDVHKKLGGFREDYFIDYVDTEYCLRAQTNGYRILAACGARLSHNLGNRRESRLGPFRVFPTHHSPGRWYTISRNRMPTWRRYAISYPHWLSYEVVASTFITLRMLLTEPSRYRKAVAIFAGTLDGLRGRMGKPPDRFELGDTQTE